MTIGLSRREAVGALAVCVTLPVAAMAQSRDASAQARALYDRLFEERLRQVPEMATSLGLDTGARAGLRARLRDLSDRFGWSNTAVAARPEIRAIDARALSPLERGYLETLAWHADRHAELVRTPWGGFAHPFTLSGSGSYLRVPDFLDTQHPVATASDAEAWLSRLEAFAVNIGHEVDRAREDARQGVIPPVFIIDKTLTRTRALRGESGRRAGLAAKLEKKATAAGLGAGWDVRAARIVDGPIAAALDRQIALLIELRLRAGIEPGVSRLPGGAAFYANCLRYRTSTELTPREFTGKASPKSPITSAGLSRC